MFHSNASKFWFPASRQIFNGRLWELAEILEISSSRRNFWWLFLITKAGNSWCIYAPPPLTITPLISMESSKILNWKFVESSGVGLLDLGPRLRYFSFVIMLRHRVKSIAVFDHLICLIIRLFLWDLVLFLNFKEFVIVMSCH